MPANRHDKSRGRLARPIASRKSFDRILIVSEGSKTEPNYFNEIRQALRLPTAHVLVRPSELGTDPLNVVRYAKQLFENGNPHRGLEAGAFEKVFAVFDRDDHTNYFEALSMAESLNGKMRNDLNKKVEFQAIASVPCFELWLLLHFEEIHASIGREDVLRRLKRHIPGYEKGLTGTFDLTRSAMGTATQRAEVLGARFTAFSAPEPFTAIASLANLLKGLGR